MNTRNDKMAQMNGYYWIGEAFQAAADSERAQIALYARMRAAEEQVAQLPTPRPGLLRRLIAWLAPRPAGDSLA